MRAYVAGPYYTREQRDTQARVAAVLESEGYSTYLPQRDAPTLSDLVDACEHKLELFDKTYAAASKLALDSALLHQSRCDIFVLTVTGSKADAGPCAQAGMAFSAGIPVVLFDANSSNPLIDPMLLGLARGSVAHGLDQLKSLAHKSKGS